MRGSASLIGAVRLTFAKHRVPRDDALFYVALNEEEQMLSPQKRDKKPKATSKKDVYVPVGQELVVEEQYHGVSAVKNLDDNYKTLRNLDESSSE